MPFSGRRHAGQDVISISTTLTPSPSPARERGVLSPVEVRMSYLGLDVGTSGCKAVVFDERGEQRALAYREYPVRHSHGSWAELDAEQVCAACKAVVAEAAAAVARDPVQALAVSSQGEAFTPVDAAGRMLAPAMVSSDARAAALAESWTAAFGAERLYRITGHTPHPMHTLFKLLWTRDHRRDVWNEAHRFLCFEDLLHAQFGLEPHMSWPLAGRTLFFDVARHAWSPEILAAIGLERLGWPNRRPPDRASERLMRGWRPPGDCSPA